jgi:hypothetical protein
MTRRSSSGVPPRRCTRRHHATNTCSRTIPATIISGAGDMPSTSNGAFADAVPRPHRLRLLKPNTIITMERAASTTPATSIFTSGRAASGLRRKLRPNTMAQTTISRPNTGRQPMKVPSRPPIRKAATPAPARAEPSAPTAAAPDCQAGSALASNRLPSPGGVDKRAPCADKSGRAYVSKRLLTKARSVRNCGLSACPQPKVVGARQLWPLI